MKNIITADINDLACYIVVIDIVVPIRGSICNDLIMYDLTVNLLKRSIFSNTKKLFPYNCSVCSAVVSTSARKAGDQGSAEQFGE